MRFWWRALLDLVTIHICMKHRFGQAFAIATLPSPRLGRCRTPAFALVIYQCVEIFDDLDAVLDACERMNVALEINASPQRLDLAAPMIRRVLFIRSGPD